MIRKVKPALVLVGYGAPHQEMVINNLKWLLQVFVAMVVGGTFDMLSGSVALAPLWISRVGFEWLWRRYWSRGDGEDNSRCYGYGTDVY